MNAAKQAAWLFTALITLACSSWYFASSSPVAQLDDYTLSITPDTIVNQLTFRQYDANGRLANYLQTPLLHHIAQNNTHWLKAPHIIIAQTDQPPWEIDAQEATSLYGGSEITFNQNVMLHQASSQQQPENTLQTETIIYYPQKKMAVTEKEATFTQPGNKVQSIGMKAFLDQKRVQLSRARGSYDPNYNG